MSLNEEFDSNILDSKFELNELCNFNVKQKWRLMYRASRDGFDADSFHTLCDQRQNNLTIIKSTNGKIFGGFNEIEWNSTNREYYDPNAFVFSLVNKENKPFKVKVSDNEYSFFCAADEGPIFGSGHDIFIATNSNTNFNSFSNFGHSYNHPDYPPRTEVARSIMAGKHYFQTFEIEVFTKNFKRSRL